MKRITENTIMLCGLSSILESLSSAIEYSILIYYEMSKLIEAIIVFAHSLHQLHKIAFELLIHLPL
jgi:hypothetical protein